MISENIPEPWEAQPAKVVASGSQTVVTVPNLHPASAYHLRILAENKLGLSEPSEVVQVTTQEEGILYKTSLLMP